MLRLTTNALLMMLVYGSSIVSANASDVQKPDRYKVKTLRAAEKEFNLAMAVSSEEHLKHLNSAIRLNPQFEKAYLARATYWMNGKNPAEAIKDFSRVISINPNNYRAINHRASCYATMQNWPLAMQDYSKEIEHAPWATSAYRNRAYVYTRMGRRDLAEKDLAKLKDFRENREMGLSARESSAPMVIEDCTRLLKKEPTNRSLYVMRAIHYMQDQQYAAAIKDYTTALSLDPEKSPRRINYNMDQVYYDRAKCYENLHAYDKAIADYGQILKLDDDAEEAFLYRGNCYFKLRQYEKAVADYTLSIKHDIDHLPTPYTCRARAYEKLGMLDLAKADNAKAKLLGPRRDRLD